VAEIDGIQLMQKVLARSPHVKVIIITGYASMLLAREAMGKGAFDFIAKPFKFKEIRATLNNAIEEIERERATLSGGSVS
jgi:DNA-binding NtrC family response regulator